MCAIAEKQGGRAALAACAARRWLARSAAGVKLLSVYRSNGVRASICASLVASLPALESVSLGLCPLVRGNLGCLLEALASCLGLRALTLCVQRFECGEGDDDMHGPFPYASAFAKLSRLTKLALTLAFHKEEPCGLADIVGALVPLTGLVALDFCLSEPDVVPAGLGRFKHLQSLSLRGMRPCVLEAGCLDLPNLRSLEFAGCDFAEDAWVLPGVAALQRVTYIGISGGEGGPFFEPQLVQLEGLQRLVLSCYIDADEDAGNKAPARSLRLPADMGLLSLSLLHLDLSGLRLASLPLALTQLVALEGLVAHENEFAELPAGITALSRLTELWLGRVECPEDPLQLHEKRPLNAVALKDLSGFPALCELTFSFCEVKLCMSMLGGAVRHNSLSSMHFYYAHPAPECLLMVLQLSQTLRRNSVVKAMDDSDFGTWDKCPAQALPPFYKFKTAMEWCAL